jgi:TonB family protein
VAGTCVRTSGLILWRWLLRCQGNRGKASFLGGSGNKYVAVGVQPLEEHRMDRPLFNTVFGSSTRRRTAVPLSIGLHASVVLALLLAALLAPLDQPCVPGSPRAFLSAPSAPHPVTPHHYDRVRPTPRPVREDAPTYVAESRNSPEEDEGPLLPEIPEEAWTCDEFGWAHELTTSCNLAAPPAPPAAPPLVEPIRIGGVIKAPTKLKHVEPAYPLMVCPRLQGTVRLDCIIGPDGRVRSVRMLEGHLVLAHAAQDAIQQWIYTPTLLNGRPVPVVMTVTVHFKLAAE